MKWAGCSCFLLLALLYSTSATADSDKWTDTEKAMEGLFLAVDVADWQQTRYVAGHKDKFYEMNPILGTHPNKRSVDEWFLLSGATQLFIAYILPHKYRQGWIATGILLETSMVYHNFNVGVRW